MPETPVYGFPLLEQKSLNPHVWAQEFALAVEEALQAGGVAGGSSYLISGGQVVHETGLTFRVSAASYKIDGVQYNSPEMTVTLDAADATHDRIDVFVLTSGSVADSVTGTPAATPVEPSVDSETQLRLVLATVEATVVTPPAVSNEDIYLENTEWTGTLTGTGLNLNSTAQPRTGTKSIEATSASNGARIVLTNAAPIDINDYDNLVLNIRNKAAWAAGREIRITWRNSGTVVNNRATIINGAYGFNSATTGSYQQVAIPTSVFGIPDGVTVNELSIYFYGAGIGLYIDDVILQAGATTPPDSGSTGGPPTGGAGGFLSGTYPSPGVNTESLFNAIKVMILGTSGITATTDEVANTVTFSLTDAPLSTEAVQDIVGAMATSGTGINAAYDDGAGTLTITNTAPESNSGLTQEQVEDIVATLLVQGSNVTLSYNDATGQLTITAAGATAHASSHISGGSDPFLSTQLLEAAVKRIQTSTGPTILDVGAIADGEYLKRSGTSIISAAVSSGGGGLTHIAQIGGSAAATLEFTSIPNTYKMLKVAGRIKSSQGSLTLCNLRFNNDSGGSYSYRTGAFSSTTATAGGSDGDTRFLFLWMPRSSTNNFCFFEFEIPLYTSTFYKPILGRSFSIDATQTVVIEIGGHYTGGSAVSSIQFVANGGNIVADAIIDLWGVS